MDKGDKSIFKEELFEGGDIRYSLKWVERAFLGILTLFGLAIIGRLIVLLIPTLPPTP